MTQIQLNILDKIQQVGVEGLKYAAGKGLGAVIMKPLRGGYILNTVPEEVHDLIKKYQEKRTLVEWCFDGFITCQRCFSYSRTIKKVHTEFME